MSLTKAWVATVAKQKLVQQQIDLGPLGAEEVEVAVEYCGLCHSDISMLNNEWDIAAFPAVFGHEAIGKVTAVGSAAKGIKVGQRVGVGWNAACCMHCRQCLSGDQHLCPEVTPTIVNHRGGFASHARSHWAWALPLPEQLNLRADTCGPESQSIIHFRTGFTFKRVGKQIDQFFLIPVKLFFARHNVIELFDVKRHSHLSDASCCINATP